ncbi:hypothetical protein PVAP13_6KG361906 [Panicum virgatum]|uniref:Uncharacterized protein n=1 Tax=Panicum virgatum TaxID=38727 RepID=A0A8T0RGA1_PANVG|nr:hypothetical protein PVAP13_6KG361906 [Panicum virgatum]
MPCRRGAVPCQPLATVIGGVGAAPVCPPPPPPPSRSRGRAARARAREPLLAVPVRRARSFRGPTATGPRCSRLGATRKALVRCSGYARGTPNKTMDHAATALLRAGSRRPIGGRQGRTRRGGRHEEVMARSGNAFAFGSKSGRSPLPQAARHGSRQATPPCTSAWPHQGSSPVDDPMSTTWTRISLPPVTSAAGWMDARWRSDSTGQKTQFPALDGGTGASSTRVGCARGRPIGS